MKNLNADPNARVLVFVDGQNLYKRCKDLFGHGCRFYTGRPDPNDEPIAARNLDRRLSGMRSAGVTVVHRPLRYHWEWAPTEQLGRPGPKSQPVTTQMHAWQRPQEKGIDLILGLEVIEFALKGLYDVGIIVSLDRDLHEIPTALHYLTSLLPHPVRLEAAVPNTKKVPKLLPNFAYTHQIDRDIFEMIRDDTAYNADDSEWTPPLVLLPVNKVRGARMHGFCFARRKNAAPVDPAASFCNDAKQKAAPRNMGIIYWKEH